MRQGYEEGLEKAREEARQAMQRELDTLRGEFALGIEDLARVRETLVDRVRGELFDLALTTAARIVRARIDDGDPIVVRVLEEALAQVRDRGSCTVRVHPDDLEYLRQRETGGLSLGVELVADPTVSRGGVFLESGEEEIDGRLETALAVLADSIAEGA